MSALRIASIGTGMIVDWFLEAVASTESVEYVGTFSRTLEKAHSWGEPRGARLFFDSLEDLAACPDIDAVYVASPNALHIPYARVLLSAGKHVLSEKPLASNRREAADAFALAHKQGVVLMEGLRSIHTPGFEGLRATLPQLGEVTSATLRMAKISSRVPALRAGKLTNTFDPQMAGGGLMDIGVYCVAPMVALWGTPQRVVAMGTTFDVSTIGADPRWPLVELAGEALCDYGSFCVNLSWGKVSDNHLPSQIMGTKATLIVDAIAHLERMQIVRPVAMEGGYGSGEGTGEELEFPGGTPLLAGELADFEAACAGTHEGLNLAANFEQVSLGTLWVMDQIRAQLGVRFPADEA